MDKSNQLALPFAKGIHTVPIDKNTVYDIPFKVKELADRIQKGQHGTIINAIVILHERKPSGNYNVFGFCYGLDNRAKMIEMCESMKLTLLGVQHGSTE